MSTVKKLRMSKRTRNKLDKRERIRDAAWSLFVERGYAETTTREVAARAGVGAGTLFLYADDKADHLARLSKIEGQIRGISRRVTDDRYGIDVLTQITAASRALQEVALSFLDDHVRGCVTDAARTDPAQAEEKFAELSDTVRRAVRL